MQSVSKEQAKQLLNFTKCKYIWFLTNKTKEICLIIKQSVVTLHRENNKV
jgi:hypothetical protein